MTGKSLKPEESVSSSPRRFVSAVIILHVIVVLPMAYFLNIWSDEASTLYTTENGLVQSFHHVLADEKQAPLYFLLLSIWRELNNSIMFSRVFSVLCSLLAIKVFYNLAQKVLAERAAILITAFFALHPFLVWASLEIRGYSLVVLLTVLLLKFFFDGYLIDEKISRQDANAPRQAHRFYILIAIAALYTNYYLGFLLAGNFIALIALRKWREAKSHFLQLAIVGAAILPLLWMIKTQLATVTGDLQTPGALAEGLRMIWNSSLNFILPTEIFPDGDITLVSFLRLWLMRLAILIGAVLLFRKRKTAEERILACGAISATIGAFLLLAYFLLGGRYVEIRHAAVLFAPLVLFVGLVLKEIFPQRRKADGGDTPPKGRRDEEAIARNSVGPRLLFALIILMAMLFSYSIFTLYPQLAKRGDWVRVARFVEQREKPNQPIMVFTVFDALNLPYHYRGVNRILPDEKFFNWGIEGEYGAADSIGSEIDFALSKIPPEAAEIWLATGERCQTTKACAPLEDFVAANYTIIEDKDFYKERVRLLRKK